MKYIIVLLAIAALAYGDEFIPKHWNEITEIRKNCLKENPLNEENLQKRSENLYPDNESVHKYLLCSLTNMGIFNEGKGLDAVRVAKQFKGHLDEAEVLAVAKKCIEDNNEGSDEVLAYKGVMCLLADEKVGGLVKDLLKNTK